MMKGRRVELVSTSDPYRRLQAGARGTVDFIDGVGVLHVTWDNGSEESLVPGLDHWRSIP
ncbi:MAG: DUF4314 domain-containing protein [Chloroflexi bacterium]|nr:DUF4314 domain-containing protein [Chloroflexota bacterium]